jgi:hypothetical protein
MLHIFAQGIKQLTLGIIVRPNLFFNILRTKLKSMFGQQVAYSLRCSQNNLFFLVTVPFSN